MSVDILMATYNGGKYLRNQLLSLQQQTYEDWVLWVRDDGSTDNTMDILHAFSSQDKRIRIVEEDSGKGLGPGKNFLGLTKFSSADYVIFCDQDDIWFEKKIEVLIEYASNNFSSEVPSLVYCDGYGYSDKEGVVKIESISTLHAKDLRGFLFFNAGYQGCSMFFNRALCQMAADYRASYFYMHDDVVSLLAHVFGVVAFLPKKMMLYRQHENNVTGNIATDKFALLRRVTDRKALVVSAQHYKEKKSFYRAYRSEMINEVKQIFLAYLIYPKLGRFRRVGLILSHGFSIGGNRLKLVVKTMLRRAVG